MQSDTGIVLVTGASGKTGSKCVDALVAAGARVRAFVRRPEAAEALRAKGVSEIHLGDLFDAESLDQAIAGAARILHICPPTHPKEAELARQVTDSAARHGCAQLVLYSVLHPTADVPHHRRKLEAETYLKDSSLTYTILQPCRYMSHLLPIWPDVLKQGLHSMPFSTRSRFSLVDPEDLADVACKVIVEPGHGFATYELAGPEQLSQEDCADIISDVIGRPVRAERKSAEAHLQQMQKAGFPPERIAVMQAMNRHYDAHGLVGNPNVLHWLLGREPRSFRSFVERLPR